MQRFKGQGMFEYILLLAGILLIVVLAVVVLRGGIFQGANKDIQIQSCQASLARLSVCYDASGNWVPAATVTPIPGACISAEGYKDAAGQTCDDGTAGNGVIKCCTKPA